MFKHDDFDVEIARAEAMRDAEIAFVNIDANGDGTICFSEAERLIKDASILDKTADSNKTKLDAFFRSFDDNSDQSISKSEWLDFYGRLFDNIIENGLRQSHTTNME